MNNSMKQRLKYLYENELAGISPSINATGVLNAIAQGWIGVEDAAEIVGEDSASAILLSAKLKEISTACNTVITSGVDVEIGDRTDHFNLALEDQNNISNLFRVVELGGTEFPYQADDGHCIVYTASEIASIYIAAQTLITTQTAYHNALKSYVKNLETAEDISMVFYGMELPEPYLAELQAKLLIASTQMEAILARVNG